LNLLHAAKSAFDAGDDAGAMRLARQAELMGAPPGGADLVRAVVQARRGQRQAGARAFDAAWSASRDAEAESTLRAELVSAALAMGELGRGLALALELLAETDNPEQLARVIDATEPTAGLVVPAADLEVWLVAALTARVQWLLWWQGCAVAPGNRPPPVAPEALGGVLSNLGTGLAAAAQLWLERPQVDAPPPASLMHLAVAAAVLSWLVETGLLPAERVPKGLSVTTGEALCAAAWRGGLADPVRQFAQCGRALPWAPTLAEASWVCALLAGQAITADRLEAADPEHLQLYTRAGPQPGGA
jgi:hypothetical protein